MMPILLQLSCWCVTDFNSSNGNANVVTLCNRIKPHSIELLAMPCQVCIKLFILLHAIISTASLFIFAIFVPFFHKANSIRFNRRKNIKLGQRSATRQFGWSSIAIHSFIHSFRLRYVCSLNNMCMSGARTSLPCLID